MVNVKETLGGLEWSVKVADGSSRVLAPESGPIHRVRLGLKGLVLKVWKFFKKAWDLGVEDPKKVIHCFKVGIALTVVSLFYYMRPLYQGVGGNAMWAVMTVVVVFEYTVGATLCKSLNRVIGTCLAGALAVGVHWIAGRSGDRFEPIILGTSVFVLASAATFSRFIPSVKARFDYGAMIFILTFSLVSVSGYRVDKLFDMAHQRLSTIAIGTSMCILISIVVCPIWAGEDLHVLITRNMEKLANSLDGCVSNYFMECASSTDDEEDFHKKLQGYKCALNSKATEESLANFARWEPAHGNFSFRHPWKQYLKVGTLIRSCAYCIEALNGCIGSENQVPEFIKNHFSDPCLRLSTHTSSTMKELAVITKTMRKSSKIDFLVGEMGNAVQDLHKALESLPANIPLPQLPVTESSESDKSIPTSTNNAFAVPLMELLPIVTVASLLLEIAERVESVVNAVDELASMADFKTEKAEKKLKHKLDSVNNKSDKEQPQASQEELTMKALQQVYLFRRARLLFGPGSGIGSKWRSGPGDPTLGNGAFCKDVIRVGFGSTCLCARFGGIFVRFGRSEQRSPVPCHTTSVTLGILDKVSFLVRLLEVDEIGLGSFDFFPDESFEVAFAIDIKNWLSITNVT
ncbi:hypothetical protein Sjap_005602 [Stephania japonica]|uniref:Aluminum-activated malate transporter 10 n=1 Tax=Stephania japonica TaxID=461633 RepID=A0AAP0K607_9MAGN